MSHTRIPSTYLSLPLPQTHRITLHFLLPPVLHLFIYTLEFSCGIALCWSLYHIGRALFCGITAALLFLPAIVTAVAILIRGSRDVPLAKRVGYAVFISIMFPVWTVYRLSQRIFWAVEALLLLRMGKKISKTNEERGRDWEMDLDEALELSIEPSSAELYLFLRAFLYSLPCLFLHSCIIISGNYDIVKGYETYMVETASIIFSLVYISMTAAYYQNFESNRLLGRNFPWRGKKKASSRNVNEIKINRGGEERGRFGLEHMPSLKEMKEENQREHEQNQTTNAQTEGKQTKEDHAVEKYTIENELGENKEVSEMEKKKIEDNQTEDDNAKQNEREDNGGVNGEQEELVKPPSSPASTCSSPPVILRREFNFPGLTMPNERAPPRPRVRSPRVPGGFRDIFCDSDSSVTTPRASREQSIRSSLFGWTYTWRPNRISRPNTTTDLNLPHSPVPQGMFPSLPIPELKKDPKIPKIVALERDDSIGLSISFCTWVFILLARMLTVGNGMYFFTKITIGVCAGHFVLMALWFIYREGRPYLQPRRLLCLAHALIAISGLLLELRVKPFARKVFFLHSTLIFVENLGLGLAWMLPIEYESWWGSYAFYTALASHLISFACAILYVYALRPQHHILPPKNLLTEAEIIR